MHPCTTAVKCFSSNCERGLTGTFFFPLFFLRVRLRNVGHFGANRSARFEIFHIRCLVSAGYCRCFGPCRQQSKRVEQLCCRDGRCNARGALPRFPGIFVIPLISYPSHGFHQIARHTSRILPVSGDAPDEGGGGASAASSKSCVPVLTPDVCTVDPATASGAVPLSPSKASVAVALGPAPKVASNQLPPNILAELQVCILLV